MIIRGGENIYRREIEDVLLEHASVWGAAVVGRPDDVPSEKVHAVLVLEAGVKLSDIEHHCRAGLARLKSPSSCEIVDALPTTLTRQIDQKPLRDRARRLVSS
jgi:acyl-CoA synthetase (AMP-forming)/AMP-acid ligase II